MAGSRRRACRGPREMITSSFPEILSNMRRHFCRLESCRRANEASDADPRIAFTPQDLIVNFGISLGSGSGQTGSMYLFVCLVVREVKFGSLGSHTLQSEGEDGLERSIWPMSKPVWNNPRNRSIEIPLVFVSYRYLVPANEDCHAVQTLPTSFGRWG